MNHVNRKAEEVSQANLRRAELLASLRQQYGYVELPTLDAQKLDVRQQLRANLDQLEDLHGRLRFILSEIQVHARRVK